MANTSLSRARNSARDPFSNRGRPIWIGGTSPAALRRAAALGDGYTGPMTREAWNTYRTELQRVGKDPSSARVTFSGSPWLTASDDPERTFALHAPGLLYFYNSPSGAHLPRPQTPEDLKRLNLVNIVTPEHAVMLIKEAVGSIPAETYGVRIAPPGVPLQYVAENIELFANKVIPQFTE